MRQTSILISLAIVAVGCSSYSPALHDAPEGKSVVYEMPVERAQRIVLTVMSSHFAGREVTPLPSPAIGYTTYTRSVLDTWSTTVTITPLLAKAAGREFDAVRIDAKGAGSSIVTGQSIFEDFKVRLKHELDHTGQVRTAESYAIK